MSLTGACSLLASVDDFRAVDCQCGCTPTDDDVTAWLEDASDVLYWASGGEWYGECQRTVRPCRGCYCGCCLGCCSIDYVPLRTPVISVDEVTIDGDVLDPAEYAVTPRGRLYRVATGARPPDWPQQQSLWRPLTEDNTFGITYTFGQTYIPSWVKNAAVELACDMANYFNGKGSKLPSGTQSVFYQGVSITTSDRADALRDAGTALQSVATFVSLTSRTGRQVGFYGPESGSAWTFPLS